MNVNKHENWQVYNQPTLSFRNYITEMFNPYPTALLFAQEVNRLAGEAQRSLFTANPSKLVLRKFFLC